MPRIRKSVCPVWPFSSRRPAGVWLVDQDRARLFDGVRLVREVQVPAYQIARCPVTVAQYRPFVEGGGYGEARYWTEEGWAWRNGAEADLSAFEQRCRDWPLVRECHMLNGEVDFILKCVAPDLRSFQRFLTEELTSADNVASVKTSLVIRGAKDDPGVPFEVLEARLAQQA